MSDNPTPEEEIQPVVEQPEEKMGDTDLKNLPPLNMFTPLTVNGPRTICFTYKNYRGEVSERIATVMGIQFKSTTWHPEPQFIMLARDLSKNEIRHFAMRDMSNLRDYKDKA